MTNRKDVDENQTKIHIYSDEVSEIMGHIPSRIIRYGTILFAVIIFLIVTLAFIFRYPETLKGTYIVQTSNPPVTMLAPSSGKLSYLLVEEGEIIKKGQLLAVVESSTDLDSYLQLKRTIALKPLTSDSIPQIKKLGSIQAAYSEFDNAIKEFNGFQSIGVFDSKITNMKRKINEINKQIEIEKSQNNHLKQKLKIIKKEYSNDSILHSRGIIPSIELQDKKKSLISEELSYNSSKLDLSNLTITLADLESQIIELKLQEKEEVEKFKLNIADKKAYLKSILSDWEQRYCLISPIKGNISLSNVWFDNQNVILGQKIMTVLPTDSSEIIAKISIPLDRAGKIKVGQSVNLKFFDYPYQEFGIIKSRITDISEVPDSSYICTAHLNKKLISNYGKEIKFKQNMQGVAEVITEDVSIAERFIFPLKAFMANNK